MCDHESGNCTKFCFQSIDSLDYDCLISLVQCTCSLVENEHLWLLDESSSECNSLLLASRKLTSSGADILINLLRVLGNEIPSIHSSERLFNFLIRSLRFTHKDVLLDGHVEHDRLLTNIPNLLPVAAQVNFFQILTVNVDISLLRVIKTLNKLNCRTFSRA